MANPRIYIFSKKVIRTNTENSVEVELLVPSFIRSFSFVYLNSKSSFLNSYKFYLYQNVYIYICILFALN